MIKSPNFVESAIPSTRFLDLARVVLSSYKPHYWDLSDDELTQCDFLSVGIYKFSILFSDCVSKVPFSKSCFIAVSHKYNFPNTVSVTVCSWCCSGVANVCLNDYMWEFAKVSLAEKTNEQKRYFPLGDNNGRNQTAGFCCRNNFNLRGCAGVAATGGTRLAHHLVHVKEMLLLADSSYTTRAQYSLLSPVTTSCVKIG